MKLTHNFFDKMVKYLEGHPEYSLKKFWLKFLQRQIKLSTVLIIVASAVVVLAASIIIGSTVVASAKFEAEKQYYSSRITALESKNAEYKEQYTQVLLLKNRFRSSIKEIVEMLYNKDTYLAVGGSSLKIDDTDEAVLLQLRTSVATMEDDQKLLTEVKDYLNARMEFISNFPFVWPTIKVGTPQLTSSFGFRKDPFKSSDLSYHAGIDIAGNKDDPVFATADGIVAQADYNHDLYGNLIVIKHKYGFETYYGHLNGILVKVGQQVKRGDRIGLIGDTGESTGFHLHYEIRKDNVAIDPMTFLNVNY